MHLYRIVVATFEAAVGPQYPVVTHTFLGRTREEAWGYHNAHRQADRFLRECEDSGRFEGRVRCQPTLTEGWIEM